MLFQILKKDMLKRKAINMILFLFITLSTVFLASSINNILVVTSAVEDYMEYANLPDSIVTVNTDNEKEMILDWMKTQKENKIIQDYEYDQLLMLSSDAIQTGNKNQKKNLDDKGNNLYLGVISSTYNRVYDQKGKPFSLSKGEIAIPIALADNNGIKQGDKVFILSGKTEKEFVVKVIMKDASFGHEMMGMSRLMISPLDYEDFLDTTIKFGIYNVLSNDVNSFLNNLNNQDFRVAMTITSDMYQMVYSFDMILSALLILVGICLILIALLVLRFTLVFTMEEQYQEIGILKAIGFKNFNIKKLYLIKYLVIVTLGALLGLLISFPVSSMMLESVSYNMIMEQGSANFFVNILSTIFVIVLVLAFCYYCTRKLNKVSAVTAIRRGDAGESFHKKRGFSLSNFKKLPVFVYLGFNDILCHFRRYIVLIITFCISFILITIPLNTINTMRSNEMLSKFALDVNSDVYVRAIEGKGETKYSSIGELLIGMDRIEKELLDNGYSASLKASVLFSVKFFDKDHSQMILTLQPIGSDGEFLQYSEGVAPVLENEVAFSEKIMEQFGWKIGDYVQGKFNGKEDTFVITGVYTDYMQLGRSARLNSKIDNAQELMYDYWSIMVDIDSDLSQKEVVVKMKQILPKYEWLTGQELVDQNVGGIQEIFGQMIFPMTMMLCVLIMLITLLMEKLFITREKGEIAMMKSIGFSNFSIRAWQVMRMVFVVLASMIISVPLSFASNAFVLKPIFKIMGASVDIQVSPWDVYVLYPGILLIGIILATIFATRAVKSIDIHEINNVE